MNIEQALDDAAHASHARLRKSYEVALAHGATDTGCRAEDERVCGTLRLITLATCGAGSGAARPAHPRR
jgi:hypothetical protein